MEEIRYSVIPAAKRLDKIDELDTELERKLKANECTISEYAQTKHALILKRNKEWATVCKAMGWPIEYNPRTYDPESVVSPRPVRDWSHVGPATRLDSIDEPELEPVIEDQDARTRKRLHYRIFWCWVLVLSALYLLSG